METKKYRVQIDGTTYTYDEGTTFEKIADDFRDCYEHRIVLGCEGYRLFELKKSNHSFISEEKKINSSN